MVCAQSHFVRVSITQYLFSVEQRDCYIWFCFINEILTKPCFFSTYTFITNCGTTFANRKHNRTQLSTIFNVIAHGRFLGSNFGTKSITSCSVAWPEGANTSDSGGDMGSSPAGKKTFFDGICTQHLSYCEMKPKLDCS